MPAHLSAAGQVSLGESNRANGGLFRRLRASLDLAGPPNLINLSKRKAMLDSHCESNDFSLFGNQLADILATVAGHCRFASSESEQDSKD
jgi:hypothetical protein